MITDYCRATMTWQSKINSGYGTTYGTAVTVTDVYIEENIKLLRGMDNETTADAMVISLQDLAFKQGDKINLARRSYTILEVYPYNKARSTEFDHVELYLSEVNNG